MSILRFASSKQGWAVAGIVLLIVVGLVSTQAFAASVTVTSQPLQNDGNGDLTYSSDWSSAGAGSSSSVSLITIGDATVKFDKPTNNYGTNAKVEIKVNSTGPKTARGFFQWDLTSIPAGATIDSASFTMCPRRTPNGGRTYNLHRVTGTWTEGSVTWNTQPAVAGTITNSQVTPSSQVCMIFTLTSDVQAWVDGTANYGIRISDNDENSATQFKFQARSREDTDVPSEHPKLDVTYTGAGAAIRHEGSTHTLDGSNKITNITVDGSKDAHGGTIYITVNLRDASNSILDAGTATLPTASGTYNVGISMAYGTVLYSDLATVQVIYAKP